jgi:putative transposase
LDVSRSGYYYEPVAVSERELMLMNKIDEIYTELPFYGSPRVTRELHRQGIVVNHKMVERLMRQMGLVALFPQKNTSKPNPNHPVFPYLLNKTQASYPNHIWGTDITFVRGHGVWFYLVAILDWYSRYVLSWRLSRTLTADFCVEALTEALVQALPEFHNSDQGSQFTSFEYVSILKSHPGIRISMDGRGRCFDNIFTERLWRTVKYEEVYLKDYRTFDEARESLQRYFQLYNNRRLHQALNYQTPADVYYLRINH